jgi:hypothetical protein
MSMTTIAYDAIILHPEFDATVQATAARALERFPDASDRLGKAVALVLSGAVAPEDGHTYAVASQSHPDRQPYAVNGTCQCAYFLNHPRAWCTHRLAAAILRRTIEALQSVDTAPGQSPAAKHVAVKAEHVKEIKGKKFIAFNGLLDMAHAAGLQELTVEMLEISSDRAVFLATAKMADGRVFSDVGDATPDNCTAMVRHAFIRMASTRARARALRSALNVDMTAVEELADDDQAS